MTANQIKIDDDRLAAIVQHFDITPDEIALAEFDPELDDVWELFGVEEIGDNEFSIETEPGEYLVLTDDEADEKAREYIAESLWYFSPSFLESYLPDGIDTDVIELIQTKCESANDPIRALVDAGGVQNFDMLVTDAIGCDERGHFLNTYDHKEHKVRLNDNTYIYIYRTN